MFVFIAFTLICFGSNNHGSKVGGSFDVDQNDSGWYNCSSNNWGSNNFGLNNKTNMAQVTVAQTTVAQIILAQMKQLIWTGLNKFGSNEHGSNDLAQKRRHLQLQTMDDFHFWLQMRKRYVESFLWLRHMS